MLNYKLDWLVEGRVLFLQIAGEYNLETVRQMVPAVKAMVDAGTAPVQVIWDMSGITTMPKNLREPVNELNALRDNPNGGWIVMISNSVMMRFAGQIATVFLGAKYRAVGSYDEAVETICRIDPSVAESLKQIPL
jgi:hypothetical protein